MAKKVGFEVVSTKPVCVDYRDGRAVSYRPGQRFEAAVTNSSVQRLLRVQEVRKLGPFEPIPPLPPKLGAPRRIQNILKRRAEVEQAKKAAQAKLAASKAQVESGAPDAELEVIDLSSPIKKKTSKKKSKSSATERPASGE